MGMVEVFAFISATISLMPDSTFGFSPINSSIRPGNRDASPLP
jgi:hypothetical protein